VRERLVWTGWGTSDRYSAKAAGSYSLWQRMPISACQDDTWPASGNQRNLLAGSHRMCRFCLRAVAVMLVPMTFGCYPMHQQYPPPGSYGIPGQYMGQPGAIVQPQNAQPSTGNGGTTFQEEARPDDFRTPSQFYDDTGGVPSPQDPNEQPFPLE
jgi:hypothetical protein